MNNPPEAETMSGYGAAPEWFIHLWASLTNGDHEWMLPEYPPMLEEGEVDQ